MVAGPLRRRPALALAALLPALVAALAPASVAAAGAVSPPARVRPAKPITLQWVGDIALSSQLGLPPGGLDGALAPLRRTLRDADLTLGNLEGTLSRGGASKCGGANSRVCFAFQAPPSVAGELRSLGFDLVNQANNHSMDYGPSGRLQTLAALHGAGIASTGLPGQITVLRVRGVRVAVLGFAPYPYDGDLLDVPAARTLVRRAKRRAPLVVVIIHAGAEGANRAHTPAGSEFYLGEDRGDARTFAHAAIDAGASIVLGSGPHVIRGVERDRGHLIAYSLGNFVGYHTLAGGGPLDDSGILRVKLGARGRLLAARWLSVRLLGGLPRRDFSNAAAKVVAALSRADFPTDHFAIGPSGLFHLGAGR
ncbi:MAG TPA: CapA family protein [Solirubrobacteraceae bacterium]|nr:CapA family protein [Solirubrobacteraceae bacterium]